MGLKYFLGNGNSIFKYFVYTQNEYQYGIGDKCIQIYIIVSIIHYIVLVFRHACTEFVGLFIMYIKLWSHYLFNARFFFQNYASLSSLSTK